MTSILRDWLASVNIQYQHDQKLENVFSNGYLIAKLLCNLQIGSLNEELFETQFVNDVSIEVITENYKLIAFYLCEGGVNIKPKLLQDIANNVSGAIHRFIYDLKCFMDSKKRETMTQISYPMNIKLKKTLNEGTSSFKSPPRITSPTRIRKYKYENMQKRDIELKIRKLVTEKFHKRSELKFEKYKTHRIEMEKSAKYEQEFENQLQYERITQRHDTLVKTLKDNHMKREEFDKFSKQKWIKNQKIKKLRIKEKKHFQTTQSLKKIKLKNVKKENTTNKIIECLDEFENILNKTQTLQKDENQEIKASELQNKNVETDIKINCDDKEDPLMHLKKLRRKLPNKTISMEKTQKFMQQIKINVSKQKKDVLQREQRRKKLIANEIERNLEKEKLDKENEMNLIINNKNLNDGDMVKQFEDKIKTIKLHKNIFKENAYLFTQKKNERKEKDEMIKLSRDRKHFEIRKVEFKTKLTIEANKLRELKLKQKQYEHVKNIKYCNKLVNGIVGITYKSVIYKQLSNQKSIPKQLWNEWIDLLLLYDKKKKKNKELELNNILLKEKQCHSHIIHIQNGLIECMDINASINKQLINKTELNNYLNAKGIWSYDNMNMNMKEPINNNLGLIIEEIISVSKGPDPKYAKIIPDVPISIVFIGKPFIGKTTQAQQIADKYALQIIDVEKCIRDAIKSFEEYENENENEELNRQQEIGERLKSILDSGQQVTDELYIDVIFDTILCINENKKLNGWILDGFPMRKSQAVLLENKLSGYIDAPSPNKPSKIAPPPEKDVSEIDKIESGLDFVFYLDIDLEQNEILFNRAKGRLVDEESGRVYHIIDAPPPHDQCIKERLTLALDEEYISSLPQHFKAWDEKKEELKNWFDKFGIWIALNCNQDKDILNVCLIEMIKNKIEMKKRKKEETKQENEKENINTENEMVWDENNKLKDENMCRRLHYFWCATEQSYICNMTSTFELLRHERRRILAYLASTREYFYNFLCRIDGKQSIIDTFQNEYNKIDSDMRGDDDTKDELHQELQELSFQLFEYSMQRKNISIEELNIIKNSIWLKTENNMLLKIIIGIIQYELHRYISTITVVKDYFALKNNKSISKEYNEPIDLMINITENGNNKIFDTLQNAIDIAYKHIIEIEIENKNDDDEKKENKFSEIQYGIINDENNRLKMRLQRLNKILNFYIKDVEKRHINLLQKLDEWIGFRINSENNAIESLVNHIQQSIEHESELNYRLILEGENFLIDKDVIVHPMPNPIQIKQTNHEFITKGAFTAKQMQQFIELIRLQNVNGIIEYNSINEIMQRLSNNSYGQNEPILPKLWNNLDEKQLDLLFSSVVIIGSKSNKHINWKLFMISLILHTLSVINSTIIVPSLDTLFDLKQAFNAKDVQNCGTINQTAFNQVLLWFDKTKGNIWQNILFDLFQSMDDVSNKESIKEINYNQLLYHLCFNDQSHLGFEKILALSHNSNIIQETISVTNEDLKLIQMRGIENVEVGNVSITETFGDKVTLNAIQENNEMVKSFNLMNIEQIL